MSKKVGGSQNSLNSKQLIFVTEVRYIFLGIGTEYLNMIYMKFMIRRVNKGNTPSVCLQHCIVRREGVWALSSEPY